MTHPTPARPLLAPSSPHTQGRPEKSCSPHAPLPTGGEHDTEPTTPHKPTTRSPQPKGANTWHYPNPNHPSTDPTAQRMRSIPCPTCNAPTNASCNTLGPNPHPAGHVHLARGISAFRSAR